MSTARLHAAPGLAWAAVGALPSNSRSLNWQPKRALVPPMRRAALLFAALLTGCTAEVRDPGDTVRVEVVDADGRAAAGAMVWTMPTAAAELLHWLPPELLPFADNPHEVLRRIGRRRTADAAGELWVSPATTLAGQWRESAGMVAVTGPSAAPARLVLSPWRWTVIVRDAGGAPVAGVPVGCAAGAGKPFRGLAIGLTDAQGQLVVRDPASVRVDTYQPMWDGVARADRTMVCFEVEGMYLRPHDRRLPLSARAPGTVELVMPPATRIEVRVPEWRGPIADWVAMTSTGLEESMCWGEAGRLFGLVGVADGEQTEIGVGIEGTRLLASAFVPSVPAREVAPFTIKIREGDAIVRARLVDAEGRPVGRTAMRLRSDREGLRTWFVRADAQGRFALVIDPAVADSLTLALQVKASASVEVIGARAELRLADLVRGERRDAGVVTLRRGP